MGYSLPGPGLTPLFIILRSISPEEGRRASELIAKIVEESLSTFVTSGRSVSEYHRLMYASGSHIVVVFDNTLSCRCPHCQNGYIKLVYKKLTSYDRFEESWL